MSEATCPVCKDGWDRSHEAGVICDDHFFEHVGDMLSINELSPIVERGELSAANQRLAEERLAVYEAASLDPDQDPSFFVFRVPWHDGDDPSALALICGALAMRGAAEREGRAP
jgi:hypothetical protein